MTNHLETITDNIRWLADPFPHREDLTPLAARLYGQRSYSTRHPSLVAQLRQAVAPGTSDDEPGLRSACASRPPVSEDALDALIRIESAVAWWLAEEFKHSLRRSVEANLHALLGEATRPIWEQAQITDLAFESSRWVTWAKVETGWQLAAITIPDPCPAPICAASRRVLFGNPPFTGQCSEHQSEGDAPCLPASCDRTHTLRVRRPDADHVWCTACGSAWSERHPSLPSVLLLEQALMDRRKRAVA